MPGPAFCALDQAYGDWGKKEENIQETSRESLEYPEEYKKQEQVQEKENKFGDFCPNCKNCINANNILQQQILDSTISQRPQWVPQNPYAYIPHDPYNRYWSSYQPPNQGYREDFNGFGRTEYFGNNNNSDALYVLLIILIALFFIQLAEMFCYK